MFLLGDNLLVSVSDGVNEVIVRLLSLVKKGCSIGKLLCNE